MPHETLPELHITTRYFGNCNSWVETRARQAMLQMARHAMNQDFSFDLSHIVVCPAGLVAAAVRPRVALGCGPGQLPWFFEDAKSSVYPHVTLACNRLAGFTPAMSTMLLNGVNEKLQQSGHWHRIHCLTASSPFALSKDPNLPLGPMVESPRQLAVPSNDAPVVGEVLFLPLVADRFSNVFVIQIREHRLCVSGRYKQFFPEQPQPQHWVR
eukprot:Protomagalhaensia_sp_Gyna_25__4729@NODE_462_length_3372_cov_173_184218_g357_i0_p2_GENE_NODE_462_length_3372_cov_173_184218_g357_i0NODE_462_length_3372_cov_173_184218_g357_i0_p2_ORF_typecomplete_len245_score15_73_NODE_462_length_3372_cov_173_184218_g357_i0101736